jgi:hypothetical protein
MHFLSHQLDADISQGSSASRGNCRSLVDDPSSFVNKFAFCHENSLMKNRRSQGNNVKCSFRTLCHSQTYRAHDLTDSLSQHYSTHILYSMTASQKLAFPCSSFICITMLEVIQCMYFYDTIRCQHMKTLF